MAGSSRREFLNRAILAGAGATVVEPFAAAPAQAAEPAQRFTDRPDPNFLIGRVIDSGSDGSLMVLTPDDEVRNARLSADAVYWKAGSWNQREITARDCVMGRGELDADGTLVVDRVWANVMKIDGTVESVDRSTSEVLLRGGDQKSYRLGVTHGTLGLDRHDRQRDGDPTVVKAAEPAFAIAYRDPNTDRLYAHRLESALADPDTPVQVEPDEPVEATPPAGALAADALAPPLLRQGNASYFCCNTSGGCGCGSTGLGYCSGCHSASWQIAWPKVVGCTAQCFSGCGCLPADFERLACHRDLYVQNACQTNLGYILVAIKDCGPNPRCRNTGCMGWDSVRFDLTACAFSALGGNFTIGHMNIRTYLA
jgi:hypothetical protein